jgi:hypothetical protein
LKPLSSLPLLQNLATQHLSHNMTTSLTLKGFCSNKEHALRTCLYSVPVYMQKHHHHYYYLFTFHRSLFGNNMPLDVGIVIHIIKKIAKLQL